ncbi:sugar ABC transporter substrate-binding protein [Bremerella cremea]|uniref:Sugar ABC transporter substrate-binding protein n=1 Tax=Bremerella cremea TaxID=1031537 RepID=A0A368KXZ7_9BACT|nr:sugar ABC transporter substrate-binding protein [Bremerella cremea]RCS54537.1 sugar ABC transporter substrate-binding protein [Bremerella cremea]
MKRLLLISLLLLSGCSSEPASPKGDHGNADKPKVALIMKSLANEFFSTMVKGAETYQAENPDQFELVVNGIKDERDLGRQVALVEEMIASNVDAIVIAPADSKALVPVLRRAKKAGIVVVNIDNRLDTEVLAAEGVEIPFVGPDNKAGAKQVGAYLASKLKQGDGVCILEGVLTSFNGQQRFAGFAEAMQDAGIKVIDHQTAEWEMSKANTIASSMLSEHPETKAVLAANDSMALGAVAAVKAAGRSGEVLIVGFDNISAVQQAIRDGKILATADQHGDQLAVFGIEKALQLLQDPQAVVEDVETPVDLITQESLTK